MPTETPDETRELTPDLTPLYAPDTVAVVGASPDSWYSSQLMDNLLDYGFDGTVYPVNPSREEAWGRTCYDAVTDLPAVPDLAVVSVPREHAVGVVRDAGRMGVPAALVITAGFGEADDRGRELEAELAAVAAAEGIRVCGPNCIGLANAREGCVLTSTCSREPRPGSIALASQSGALAFTTFFERAADEDVHFSHLVSTGNEADLSLTDHVAYLRSQPAVDAVCAYVEGVDDPRRFAAVVRESTAAGTPVLAVKVGRSAVAETSARSHTGSLTGPDALWDAALWQAGAERVPDVPDLLWRARAHAAFDPPASNRVCVASTSGGLASLLADLADERGLTLPPLTDETEATLLDMDELLTFEGLHNPVDVRGYGADALPEIAEALFADDSFDAYVFAVGLPAVDERAADIADGLLAVAEMATDPVLFLWTGRKEPMGRSDPQPYERVRREVPLFYDPARCLDALASLRRFGEARDRVRAVDAPVGGDAADGSDAATVDDPSESKLPADSLLDWPTAAELLGAFDVDLVETVRATDAADAAAAADRLGYPVVAKVDSPDVAHRAALGGVRTGLASPEAVRAAHDAVRDAVAERRPDAAVEGVLVQREVDGDAEFIVGATRDEAFGPTVTVGVGGTAVEERDDAVHLLAPVDPREVRAALDRTDLPGRLRDTDASADDLADLVAAVGRLVAAREDVAELDLNPVVAGPDGLVAVDALVRTRSG